MQELSKFRSNFVFDVIDEVLENFKYGLETNNYRFNQFRVATVKYIGELYNYRMLDSKVVFDTLWSLVTFGHRKFLARLRLRRKHVNDWIYSRRKTVARYTLLD